MKTRTGFVSNSSSSSFILQFPHEITSADDILPLLGYVDEQDADATPQKVAEFVFGELGSPLTKDDIYKLLSEEFNSYSIKNVTERERYEKASNYRWRGYQETIGAVTKKYKVPDDKSLDSLTDMQKQQFMLEYSEAQMEFQLGQKESDTVVEKITSKYIPTQLAEIYHPEKVYYEADFSDNDSRLSGWCEHNGFDHLKAIRFSHH